MAKIDGTVLVDIRLQTEKLLKDLKNVNKNIEEFAKKSGGSIKGFSDSTDTLKQAKRNFDTASEGANNLKSSTLIMSNLASDAIKKVISSSLNLSKQIFLIGASYESAFVGVRKTVNGTEKELNDLKQAFIDMSKVMPISANELAKIGESAGQLGIKTKNIKGFVKTMADLSNSTNLSSEQASTDLARLANITQMSQNNFDRLGSAIVGLGNNFATTESEIVAMALNLAGAGKQVGLTEAQMLATATALSSVGIEAQAGGTAISTMLIEMKKAVTTGDGLEAFAKTANLSISEFSDLFNKNASQALNTFIRGLGTAQERGQDALLLLDDLGISETRLTKALLSLGGANNVLNDALKVANVEWIKNTALTKEAEQRYNTMESKLAITSNGFKAIAISMYDEFQEPFKDGLNDVIETLDEFAQEMNSPTMKSAIKEFAQTVSGFLKNVVQMAKKTMPYVIKLFSWFIAHGSKVAVVFGASTMIHKTANALDKVKVSMVTLKTAQNNATIAQRLLNLAMNANPYFLLATALVAIGTAIFVFGRKTSQASEKFSRFTKEIDKGKQKISDIKKSLADSVDDISVNTAEWKKLKNEILSYVYTNGELIGNKDKLKQKIDELNKSLGETLYFYDEETGKIINQKGEIVNLSEELSKVIDLKRAEAYLEATKDEYIEALKLQNEQRKAQKDLLMEINSELEKELLNGNSAKEMYGQYVEVQKKLREANQSNDSKGMMEYAERLENLRQGFIDAGVDIDSVVVSFGKIKEASENISINQEIIDNFQGLGDAIEEMDATKVEAFMSGLSSAEIENTAKTVGGLEEKVKSLKEAKELAIKSGDLKLSKSFDDDIKQTQKLIDGFKEKLNTDVSTSSNQAGQELKNGISQGMEQATSEALTKWNSLVFNPKHAQVIVDYINGSSSKGGYRYNGGSASFDDLEGLAYETFNRLTSTPSNTVHNNSNVSVNQTNNFNVPVNKPSEVSRAIDKVNRDLARRL